MYICVQYSAHDCECNMKYYVHIIQGIHRCGRRVIDLIAETLLGRRRQTRWIETRGERVYLKKTLYKDWHWHARAQCPHRFGCARTVRRSGSPALQLASALVMRGRTAMHHEGYYRGPRGDGRAFGLMDIIPVGPGRTADKSHANVLLDVSRDYTVNRHFR